MKPSLTVAQVCAELNAADTDQTEIYIWQQDGDRHNIGNVFVDNEKVVIPVVNGGLRDTPKGLAYTLGKVRNQNLPVYVQLKGKEYPIQMIDLCMVNVIDINIPAK